jgi:microcystin-dependent protein
VDPFVAEIRILACNFPPKGWAFCDGQLMPISQNTALFSLLGTTYGGDGKSNFALPNLQGAVPMHPGQGPGLSLHDLGEQLGSDTVTLIESEIAAHDHGPVMSSIAGGINSHTPGPSMAIAKSQGNFVYDDAGPGSAQLDLSAVAPAGGDQPHNNLMPYLTLNFCIAMQGVYPPRT